MLGCDLRVLYSMLMREYKNLRIRYIIPSLIQPQLFWSKSGGGALEIACLSSNFFDFVFRCNNAYLVISWCLSWCISWDNWIAFLILFLTLLKFLQDQFLYWRKLGVLLLDYAVLADFFQLVFKNLSIVVWPTFATLYLPQTLYLHENSWLFIRVAIY